jgi:hypothetical protein
MRGVKVDATISILGDGRVFGYTGPCSLRGSILNHEEFVLMVAFDKLRVTIFA